MWSAHAHIDKRVHRLRAVPVEAEGDNAQMIPAVSRWSQEANGSVYKEVVAISEAPQSVNPLSSDFIWVAGVTFIAASDQAEASSFHICRVAFHTQHARSREEQENTSIPVLPEHARLDWVLAATTNRDNSSTQLLQNLPHIALECHLQTTVSHPYQSLKEKPIPPAAALRSHTAA